MPNEFDALNASSVRSQHSAKWTWYPEDVLPLWVADMDFPISDAIRAALKQRVDEWLGYGYFYGDTAIWDHLIAQAAGRGWHGLTHEHFWPINGVVSGLYAGVMGLSSHGDEILTQAPIYPPFLSSIKDHGRIALESPMRQTAHGWEVDFDHLESLVTPGTRVFMLCNPQNPTGRVYTRQELERMAEIVLKHRLYVISDELHADLILDDLPHVPFASLSPEIAQRTVTVTGPCKAFNTAGLGAGVAISQNPKLLERMKSATKGLMGHANVLSLTMWRAGLEEGGPWLREALGYIRDNRDFMTDFLRTRLPRVRCAAPQGTYLAWLDFREYACADRAHAFMLETAKVGLNDGPAYGTGYQGFLRINLATSRAILTEALERMERALATLEAVAAD